MSIRRVECPECKAVLTSKNPAGFTVGQTLECPKCGTYFAVEASSPPPVAARPRPAAVVDDDDEEDDRPRKKVKVRAVVDDDEDEDDRPRKKKKKRASDDEGGGYKNSPVRFIVLGILVIVMLVLGFMLYQKRERERENGGFTTTDQRA